MNQIQSKKTILVAEDDTGISELLRAILEQSDYKVIVCSDGKKIMPLATSLRPDVMLMDLWMPGADGRTVTKELKANPETKTIPILIVSAQTDLEAIAKKAGADGYLAKPFDIDALLKEINNQLKKKN